MLQRSTNRHLLTPSTSSRYLASLNVTVCKPTLFFIESRRCNNSNDAVHSGTVPEPTPPTETSVPSPSKVVQKNNTRQRHRFKNKNNLSMDDIPSFQDFQRMVQIRTLYRQYTRLIGLYHSDHDHYNSNSSNKQQSVLSHLQKIELQNQVRTEFKHHKDDNHKTDLFYIQKSLAEGQRRYKELEAMIRGGNSSDTTATTTTTAGNDTATTIETPGTTTTSSVSTINHTTTNEIPSSSSSLLQPPPKATDIFWPWNNVRQQQEEEEDTNSTEQSESQQQPHRQFSPFKFPPKSTL